MTEPGMSCADARGRIRDFFVTRREALLAPVRPHLDRCPECAQLYDRLFDAEAALAGDRIELSPAERDLLLDRALPRAARSRAGLLAGLLAATGAAAALLLVTVYDRGAASSAGDALQARGPEPSADDRAVTLRLLCVRDSGAGEVTSLAIEGSPGATPACPRSGTLALSYRNSGAALRYLKLVVRDDAAPPALLPADAALPLPPTPLEVAVPLQIDLTSSKAARHLQVEAWVLSTPEEARDLTRAVAEGRQPETLAPRPTRWLVRVEELQP